MNKDKLKPIFSTIYFALAARIFFAMLLFTLCRILFYLFNTALYPDMTFGHFLYLEGGGLRFDLTAVLYTNCLFIAMNIVPFRFRYNSVYQKFAEWIFYVFNGIALMANCIDIIYFRFTLRRTTWSVFQEFSYDTKNTSLMGRFLLDYWYILLIYIALIALMVWLYKRIKLGKPVIKNRWIFYLVHTAAMASACVFTVAGVRGGFIHSTRPITNSNAAQYVKNPTEVGIVLNTPFSIYRTITQPGYQRLNYFESEEELHDIYSPIHYTLPKDSIDFTPKNLVIIILESFGSEYIGALNKDSTIKDYAGYTPFLDSLIGESLIFEHSFANGRKSIDAMPSVLASIPSFSSHYVLSDYANNTIVALPALLKEKGYDCSFLHGAPNGSMGFQAFANMAGFQHYYGKTEFGDNAQFDGWWGIWDEPFLQFCADIFNQKTEPFMASIFTVSSHHPYQVPPQYENVFPKGTIPIHQCIGYSDQALRKFFATMSKQPWFYNTLFVITADHTSRSYYPEYNAFVGNFKVPVIFYEPGNEKMKGIVKDRVVQQIDIMPTTLNYLHYDKPYFAFGEDAFDENSENKKFAVNFLNGVYLFYENNYVLEASEQEALALYNYETDPFLKENLKEVEKERLEQMYTIFKAFLQQYNNALIDDKTTVRFLSNP